MNTIAQPTPRGWRRLRELGAGAALSIDFARKLLHVAWRSVLPHVPFANVYRAKLRLEIRDETRRRLACFHRLGALDMPTKRALLPRVARAQGRLALVSVCRTRVERTAFFLAIGVMLTATSIDGVDPAKNPPWSALYLFDPVDFLERLWQLIIKSPESTPFVPHFGVVLVTLIVLAFFLNRANEYPLLPLFGVTLGIVAVGMFIDDRYLNLVPPRGVAFTMTALALLGAIFFLLLVGAMIGALFKRWRKKLYPDSIIIDGLITILWKLERDRCEWAELGFRREIASRLEEVAYSVQHGLPSRLRNGDVVADTWVRRTARQQAAALRAFKKWLAVPMADTREQLVQRLAHALRACASGNWDALERQEPETLSGTDQYARIATVVRMLFVAVLPLAALRVYSGVTGVSPEPLQLLAILWGVGTVLTSVDPLFGARVTVFKDLLDVMPMRGRPGS